jgi:hypothetical protein
MRSLLIIVILISSCSVLNGVNRKEFIYYRDNRPEKLLFRLPKGKAEESFRIGENNAKEQFYYLSDGTVFYVSRLASWQTVNTHRIADLKQGDRISAFSGRDNNQLYWKEVHLEDFRIGYAYVNSSRLEEFNDALNSVRLK